MKIIYRILCGGAAICVGLGLLLGIIGTALGARPADLSLSAIELPALRFLSRIPPVWGQDTVETSYPGASIRRLDFDLETMNVTISEGDGFSIRARNVNARRFTTEVDGGTWEINCDNKGYRGSGGERWGRKAPEVTITVPRGWVAEEAEIELGMGSLVIQGLTARQSCLDIGMGTAAVSGFISRDCDITVGMGSLTLEGDLTGKGSITCGMGTAELLLSGAAGDYGCTASAGMGSITFNGHETGGLAGGMTIGNTEGKHWFDIECGMGTVDVLFAR